MYTLQTRSHPAEEIGKRRFHSENTSNVFSIHTTPEKCENVAITGHFGFVVEEDSGREIT